MEGLVWVVVVMEELVWVVVVMVLGMTVHLQAKPTQIGKLAEPRARSRAAAGGPSFLFVTKRSIIVCVFNTHPWLRPSNGAYFSLPRNADQLRIDLFRSTFHGLCGFNAERMIRFPLRRQRSGRQLLSGPKKTGVFRSRTCTRILYAHLGGV